MPSSLRIDELAAECNKLDSEMEFTYRSVAPSIEFSNTGRRGEKKYFSISLIELLETLKDIQKHLPAYEAAKEYVERNMRDLFSRTITSKTVNAQSTVQTLPLFSLLNKFIYVANGLNNSFDEKVLTISDDYIKGAIDYLESQLPDNDAYLKSLVISDSNESIESSGQSEQEKPLTDPAENKIFYGAPGTGKSHEIDINCSDSNSVRTVFHPDTQNSDFVGCLKPGMDNSNIVYSFRPGPFCLALKLAHELHDKHVFLVIEEINRAAAAAVFGELFQLLDRKSSGESRYSITVSDPDMLRYLELNASSVLVDNRLRIPRNLNLYATMNSSDQAVMPMDTAFKRRWKFEYIPIDFQNVNAVPQGSIPLNLSGNTKVDVPWAVLAESINKVLETENIPEDRLLGPWFLSGEELADSGTALKSLRGKVLLYLWDDVLRHNDKSLLFSAHLKTFSSVIKLLDDEGAIFSRRLEELLIQGGTKLNDSSPNTLSDNEGIVDDLKASDDDSASNVE